MYISILLRAFLLKIILLSWLGRLESECLGRDLRLHLIIWADSSILPELFFKQRIRCRKVFACSIEPNYNSTFPYKASEQAMSQACHEACIYIRGNRGKRSLHQSHSFTFVSWVSTGSFSNFMAVCIHYSRTKLRLAL